MESLHIGCVGVTDRFFPSGRLSRKSLQSAVNHCRKELQAVRNQYRAVGWDTAIGASGTVLAARGVLTQLEDNPATTISPEGLKAVNERMAKAGPRGTGLSCRGCPSNAGPCFPAEWQY